MSSAPSSSGNGARRRNTSINVPNSDVDDSLVHGGEAEESTLYDQIEESQQNVNEDSPSIGENNAEQNQNAAESMGQESVDAG
jgi:hypothetical protein